MKWRQLCGWYLLPLVWLTVGVNSKAADGGKIAETVTVDGRARNYWVHVPANAQAKKKLPLVLAFHGGGDNAAGMEKLTQFSALADREGFLVVYPEAVGHQWNDGRKPEKVDDVAFVRELIEVLQKDHRADPARVYATGFSNGAIFCHLLGARLADRVAAIAPVSGGIAEPIAAGFKPERAVSVFAIHGTSDPLVPFEGGAVDHGFGGRTISTQEALRLWIRRDGCGDRPVTGSLPDLEPRDHCTVQWSRWNGGRHRTEVLLYTINGGGHTWPGGRFLPVFLMGWKCEDFHATEVIWEFFKTHPRSK